LQEDNWIVAAKKVVHRYKDWQGQNGVLKYVDIWTEWPNKSFWDRPKADFIRFWAKAFKAIKEEFPNLKVGGPGFLAPTMDVVQGNLTNNEAIDFLTELYNDGLKPDWIGWHLWHNTPETYYQAAHQFRDLLNGVGDFSSLPWAGTDFFKNTELICNAYGTSDSDDLSGNPQPLPVE